MSTTEATGVRGLWCASLTPITPEGHIDCGALAEHIRWLYARKVRGVVLFGTTGEGPSFSVRERQQTLEQLLALGLPPSRMMIASGCASWDDTLSLTQHAVACGCQSALVLPPFFWKNLTPEACYQSYAKLIEALDDSRLRLYLYHIPQLSAVPIHRETIARLADTFPTVIAGVKDSSGDFAHTMTLIKEFPQLAILSGHEPHLPELMLRGCAGTICGLANLVPELIARLLEHDSTSAGLGRVCDLLDQLNPYAFVPALKAIRAWQTANPNWQNVRTPLLPLSASEREHLTSELGSLLS